MKPLPIGVDDFEKLITKGYYYVDKTLFIKELLDRRGTVNLFTRPRRFGKTLNLSMLRYYFEDIGVEERNRKNRELFSGLAIEKTGEEYAEEMCQYPVIMVTLKSAKQRTYQEAMDCLREALAREYARHEEQIKGKLENQEDWEKFMRIRERRGEGADYLTSLAFLSECLYQAYQKKSIILIDEYDVPLENAYFAGFYEEMVSFIRSLFESALKTNPYLEFAVATGCLRVSKESIFTGLNNLRVYSVLNENYQEYFGFTKEEVQDMLKYYGREKNLSVIKEWYDGYCFGSAEVYNPWSILNHMEDILTNQEAFPLPYWANTSSNSVVRDLVEKLDDDEGMLQEQLECLMNGGTIEKAVREDITYDTIYDNEENLWNFLFFTGYLKKASARQKGNNQYVTLAIPNREVSYIYQYTIHTWFDKKQKNFDMMPFYTALEEGDTDKLEEEISRFLEQTISYFDYGESYYHGFLAGLLQRNGKYRIFSNREAGVGRADLILKTPRIRRGRAVILELKAVKRFQDMEKGCQEALMQIEKKKYKEELQQEGYQDIVGYGMCFYRKECIVRNGLNLCTVSYVSTVKSNNTKICCCNSDFVACKSRNSCTGNYIVTTCALLISFLTCSINCRSYC